MKLTEEFTMETKRTHKNQLEKAQDELINWIIDCNNF